MGLEHDDRLVLGPSNTKISCEGRHRECPDLVSCILLLYRIPLHGLERLRDPPGASPLDGRWPASKVPYSKGVGRAQIAPEVEENLLTLGACAKSSARRQSIHGSHVRASGDDRLVWSTSVGQDRRDKVCTARSHDHVHDKWSRDCSYCEEELSRQ